MKRIKYWIMKLSLRKKLVFYSYLIITPILLLISALLFFENFESAVNKENEYCQQSVKALSDNIDSIQKNIMEIGTYLSVNNEINLILSSNKPNQLNEDTRLWYNNAPIQMLQDIIAINGQIKTVAIYPENGVNPYLRCMDAHASYLSDIETVQKTDIYQTAVAARGKVLWQRVGKYQSDTYASNYSDKMVMYREIYDLTKKKKLGYLVIGSSADRLDKVCDNSLRSDQENIIILSVNGAVLNQSGNIKEDTIAQIIDREVSSETSDGLLNEYNIYRIANNDTGTIVYKLVPKQTLASMLGTIVATPMAMLLGFLAGLYPIMAFVSKIVSKPLNALSRAMQEFKKGDFSQKVEVTTLDEVGEASACFNEMVDDMKELIDKNYVMALKEKESELDALQAQINPHFLYNTLDSLYWRVIETGDEEIAEDIIALSQLFRLVLSRGEGIVAVRHEGELLERYLQIQKMRFGRRLEYQIQMDEAILEEQIPKLILQPFVENAIVHGFEQAGDNYFLSIEGKLAEGYMNFVIRDTGVGMNKEQVAALWDVPDTSKYASQRIGKYAIKNVKERLELKYYEDFELKIESEEGQGTTVFMRIPCHNSEEADNGSEIADS